MGWVEGLSVGVEETTSDLRDELRIERPAQELNDGRIGWGEK